MNEQMAEFTYLFLGFISLLGVLCTAIWHRHHLERNRLQYQELIQHVEWGQGGILKRLDEHRELIELLQRSAPTFLRDHFWVYSWLKSQDDFLQTLTQSPVLTQLNRWPAPPVEVGTTIPSPRAFPRPFPATLEEDCHPLNVPNGSDRTHTSHQTPSLTTGDTRQ